MRYRPDVGDLVWRKTARVSEPGRVLGIECGEYLVGIFRPSIGADDYDRIDRVPVGGWEGVLLVYGV